VIIKSITTSEIWRKTDPIILDSGKKKILQKMSDEELSNLYDSLKQRKIIQIRTMNSFLKISGKIPARHHQKLTNISNQIRELMIEIRIRVSSYLHERNTG
jgi:hypothetical protein